MAIHYTAQEDLALRNLMFSQAGNNWLAQAQQDIVYTTFCKRLMPYIRSKLYKVAPPISNIDVEAENILSQSVAKVSFAISKGIYTDNQAIIKYLVRIIHNTSNDFLQERGSIVLKDSDEMNIIVAQMNIILVIEDENKESEMIKEADLTDKESIEKEADIYYKEQYSEYKKDIAQAVEQLRLIDRIIILTILKFNGIDLEKEDEKNQEKDEGRRNQVIKDALHHAGYDTNDGALRTAITRAKGKLKKALKKANKFWFLMLLFVSLYHFYTQI